MNIVYGKRFSKDLDFTRNEPKVRKRLLGLIKKIKEINALTDLKEVKKLKVIQTTFV